MRLRWSCCKMKKEEIKESKKRRERTRKKVRKEREREKEGNKENEREGRMEERTKAHDEHLNASHYPAQHTIDFTPVMARDSARIHTSHPHRTHIAHTSHPHRTHIAPGRGLVVGLASLDALAPPSASPDLSL